MSYVVYGSPVVWSAVSHFAHFVTLISQSHAH